jgi:hypothetical protein
LEPTHRRRLPIWTTVAGSYSFVWSQWQVFIVPLLLLFVASFGGTLVKIHFLAADDIDTHHLDIRKMVFVFGYLIVLWFISVSFAVGIHRSILLNETRTGIAFLRWDDHFRRYLWISILLIALLIALCVLIIAAISTVATVLVVVSSLAVRSEAAVAVIISVAAAAAFLFLVQRLVLCLPAAALGEKDCFALSWRATRGNALRLMAIACLVALPYLVLSLIVAAPQISVLLHALATHSVPPAYTPGFVTILFDAIVQTVMTPIFVAMLSLCYGILVQGNGSDILPAKAV